VIVNVKVLVAASNSQTTDAVEKLPLSTPTTVIVSAFAVALMVARSFAVPMYLNVQKNPWRSGPLDHFAFGLLRLGW
jgi:hypothetical protein